MDEADRQPTATGDVLLLRSGDTITIRDVRPADKEGLARFYAQLSPPARRQRFFGPLSSLPPDLLHAFSEIRSARDCALVAEHFGDGAPAIVADGRALYDAAAEGCELGLAVADAWHRAGIATALLTRLEEHARRIGSVRLYGFALAENRPVLALALRSGYTYRASADPTVFIIEKRLRDG